MSWGRSWQPEPALTHRSRGLGEIALAASDPMAARAAVRELLGH